MTAQESPQGTTFKERMDLVIKKLGGPRAASSLIGVTEESLANWKKDRVNPSFNGIKALARAAEVSLDWLTYGAGPSATNPRYMFIPRLDGTSLAPLPDRDGAEDSDFAVSKHWARTVLGIDPDNLAMTHATTDSMEPTVRTGDILLVDTGTTAIAGDGLYLLRHHDAPLLRRLQTLTDGTVILKADNPAYTDERLNAADIQAVCVLGLVKWIGRRG